MKKLGIVLIIAGVAMLIVRGINFQTNKKVVDLGPVEINKKENKSISWPNYAGVAIIIVGAVLIISDRKNK